MESEKQSFINACFTTNRQEYYKDYIKKGSGRIQLFNTRNEILSHKYWMPDNICCHTNQILTKDNIDIKIGYWTPFLWKPIHKDFKQIAMKEEAYQCQLIDCSCNDCISLNRTESKCDKKNIKLNIHPNMCNPQNQSCFNHRKDI